MLPVQLVQDLSSHIQVTLEKRALLDPVFDTFDTVGTFEEVGDAVPAEETVLVRMHACMYMCM